MDVSNEQIISIIMPAYNSEKYIEESICSVIFQTIPNWELIVINDGSIDETGKIADAYSEKDKRIKVLHSKNKGVSSARNIGIANATGKWVTFLDSDDKLNPYSLYNLLTKSENKDLVIGNFCEFPYARNIEYLDDIANIAKEKLITLRSIGSIWGMIFRRDILKILFLEELKLGEDTVFLLEYLKYCDCIATVKNITYMYRTGNKHSLSHQRKNLKLLYVEKYCQLISEILGYDKEYYYAYVVHNFIHYVEGLDCYHYYTESDKKERIKEVLENECFRDIPLKQLRLESDEMHLFIILKIGDMKLIKKEFGIK